MTWRPLTTGDAELPEPVTVGRALDRLVTSLGGPGAGALAGLFSGWDEAVGPAIAAHARPLALRDGVLVVAVDQPGWATQLRFLEADLVARLADLAPGAVSAVDIRVRRGDPGPGAGGDQAGRGRGAGSRRDGLARW